MRLRSGKKRTLPKGTALRSGDPNTLASGGVFRRSRADSSTFAGARLPATRAEQFAVIGQKAIAEVHEEAHNRSQGRKAASDLYSCSEPRAKKAKRSATSPSKKWYVVFKGRSVGLVQGWDRCSEETIKFPGAVFLGYSSKEQAEVAWATKQLEDHQAEGVKAAKDSDDSFQFAVYEASLDVLRRSISAAERGAHLFFSDSHDLCACPSPQPCAKLDRALEQLTELHDKLDIVWTEGLEEQSGRAATEEAITTATPTPVEDDFCVSDFSEEEVSPSPTSLEAQSQIASTRLGQAREDLAATAERLEAAKAALEGDQAATPSDTPPKKQHYIPLATSLLEIHQYSASVADDRASVAATDLAQAPVGQPSSDPKAAILAILKAKKQRAKNKKRTSKSKGKRSPPSSVSN